MKQLIAAWNFKYNNEAGDNTDNKPVCFSNWLVLIVKTHFGNDRLKHINKLTNKNIVLIYQISPRNTQISKFYSHFFSPEYICLPPQFKNSLICSFKFHGLIFIMNY